MKRVHSMIIKSIPVNQTVKIFDSPEIKDYCKNNGVKVVSIQNAALQALRVIPSDKSCNLYFRISDVRKLQALESVVTATARLEFVTQNLVLARFPHQQYFPELFSNGKEGVWFGVGLSCDLDCDNGIVRTVVSRCMTLPHLDAQGFSTITKPLQNEIASILNGELFTDLAVEILFEDNEQVQVDKSAPSVANSNDLLQIHQVSVRGRHEYEVSSNVVTHTHAGLLPRSYEASFLCRDDAFLYAEIKKRMLNALMDPEDFIKAFDRLSKGK